MREFKVIVTAKIKGHCYIQAKDQDQAEDIADSKRPYDFEWEEPESFDYESIEPE